MVSNKIKSISFVRRYSMRYAGEEIFNKIIDFRVFVCNAKNNLFGLKYLCALTTVMVLLSGANVWAQTVRDTSLAMHMDQVVITAQFTPTDARATVNTVKVINRKIIEQRGAVNLQELLQTEPNIRLSQDAILGSGISMNGLNGQNIKILIDGVPVVGRQNGSIDAGQIPLNTIQKIEIIEGTQSMLYGSDASGGVINLITKKSQIATIETEINTQVESNGFKNLAGRLGIKSGKLLCQLNGNYQEFNPLIDTSVGRDQLWNPKKQSSARILLRYTPSDKLDVRLTGGLMKEKIDNLGGIRRAIYKPYAFDDYYITDRYDINLYAEKWTKNKTLIQSTLSWNGFYRQRNSYRIDFDDNKLSLLDGQQDTSSANGILARFTAATDRNDKKWNFLAGLENYTEYASGLRIVDTTSSTPGQAYTNDLGIFASAKYKIAETLTLQGGSRYTINHRYGSAMTPSAWAMWKPKLPLQVRMSWAYGFRSPSIKELFFSFVDVNHFVVGNRNLVAEKSLNLRGEITWEGLHLRQTKISFTGAGFYNRISNRIILSQYAPVQYQYRNLDIWETRGGSLRLKVNVNDRISFQSDVIATGYFNSYAEGNDTLSKLLWSVDWVNDLSVSFLKGRINWNLWHKRTGLTPYFYEDRQGVINQGQVDSWNMLNTGISTAISENKVKLNFGIKNIFNIRQLQPNSGNGIHIEQNNQQNLHWGRNYYVSVIFQWHNK
ncbi:MAG: TonB-dependent receptor [Saprospiraceae bacterium]|nr:TonB-dependent receptor [Saprospiraceae bacterium]